jgi:hypothetical protein
VLFAGVRMRYYYLVLSFPSLLTDDLGVDVQCACWESKAGWRDWALSTSEVAGSGLSVSFASAYVLLHFELRIH